ncbi:MAG TPA: CapA family protein [Jiangellaceae bacterium]|jgi:poly-gamma-glutamate synthesis protein (capsule biosynthesis protein)|nr:CapA family protein [Jiangellaceae bacterium]
MPSRTVRLLLCGDVMTGRGVDQILPYPGDPVLREQYVRDARRYVEFAEAVNGPIPRPVDFSWPWGDALDEIDEAAPDLRLVNLETSVTRSDDFEPGKAVHYRMNPPNVPCLTAARLDICTLANNHVLDFGARGLEETLDALTGAGLQAVGAGRDAHEAGQPVTVELIDAAVTVFSFGMPSSGVPARWVATDDRPGVNVITKPSGSATAELLGLIGQAKGRGEVIVVSMHWGSNWGYDVPAADRRFGRRLIDAGADVVFGHSSHHPRPIEVYRDKLILHGCGDLIDDYEGITGYEEYRDDLRLLYFADLAAGSGQLSALRMVPFQARQIRLHRASAADTGWLAATLNRASGRFGSQIRLDPDGSLMLGAV